MKLVCPAMCMFRCLIDLSILPTETFVCNFSYLKTWDVVEHLDWERCSCVKIFCGICMSLCCIVVFGSVCVNACDAMINVNDRQFPVQDGRYCGQ